MTKLPQCSETARHGSAYMGRSAKVAVDVDAQVTNDADWYHGSTTDRDGAARKLRLPTSRCTPHHLSFLSVKLQTIRSHPVGYVVDCKRNDGRQTGGGSRRTRTVNLAVVSVLVQRQIVVGDNGCQISSVDDEEDRSKDRSLWHTTDYIRDRGSLASTADMLLATGEVG